MARQNQNRLHDDRTRHISVLFLDCEAVQGLAQPDKTKPNILISKDMWRSCGIQSGRLTLPTSSPDKSGKGNVSLEINMSAWPSGGIGPWRHCQQWWCNHAKTCGRSTSPWKLSHAARQIYQNQWITVTLLGDEPHAGKTGHAGNLSNEQSARMCTSVRSADEHACRMRPCSWAATRKDAKMEPWEKPMTPSNGPDSWKHLSTAAKLSRHLWY